MRSSGFLCTIEKSKEFMNILFNWKYLKLFNWQQVTVAKVCHTLCDCYESFHKCDYWGLILYLSGCLSILWSLSKLHNQHEQHVQWKQSVIQTNNMCTRDNQLLKPTANAQSQSHTVCHLLDPWQIEIYHVNDYSRNIFLCILHSILYTGNEF